MAIAFEQGTPGETLPERTNQKNLMTIRSYRPGDDLAQVSIYNEAAAALPQFKPASLDETRRRIYADDFDPTTRFFAESNGMPVGYLMIQANGRIGYPWCRVGFEDQAPLLLQQGLDELRRRGLRRALTAYRASWTPIHQFFLKHGFSQAREMVNFVLDLVDMPTPSARANQAIGPVSPSDIPQILTIGKGVLQISDPAELEKYLFHNPLFRPDSLFAMRNRSDRALFALGMLVTNPDYANPHQVDSAMPCFRLGAFGSEGMTTKRIDGLFSFLSLDQATLMSSGVDLLCHAVNKLQNTEIETFAAQVPSDAPHLLRFYKNLFRRQASFPVFELAL